MRRLGKALDRRLRLGSALAELKRSAPEPGGRLWDSPPYSLGRLTLLLVVLLTASGVVLAFFYQPTAEGAAASIQRLQAEPSVGRVVRGVHRWAALMLLAMTMLHGLRAWLVKAFRYPRELGWWLGVVLLVLVAILGATGYLLRWDIKAFSLMDLVVTNFGGIPIIGPVLIQLLLGGSGEGTIPLHRGYAVHVWFLPTLLLLLVGIHLVVVARQGLAEPARLWRAWRARWRILRTISWLPAVGLLVAVTALALVLPEPANPVSATAVSATPHPDWLLLFYFLPFWLFEGRARVIGTLLLPLSALFVMLIAPRIDTARTRRLASVGLGLLGVAAVVFLLGQTASMGSRVPTQGCPACHRPTMVGDAPRTLAEFDTHDPDWLVFHLRQPVRSILIPYEAEGTQPQPP